MRYIGPEFIILILVEMLLVGRGLFVLPALVGLPLSRRRMGLILWGLLSAFLGFLALSGAWWPVWWRLTWESEPMWFVRVLGSGWLRLPGILAAVRLLLGFVAPVMWGLSTVPATIRGVLEQVAPEVPNTPLTPVDLVTLLDLFGWARPDDEGDDAEPPEYQTVVHNIPNDLPAEQVHNGVMVSGGGVRTVTVITEWFLGTTLDQKLANQYAFAQYVLRDPAGNYSRNGTRRFFASDPAGREFFEWMREQHFARNVNARDQRPTDAGLFVLQALVDDYEYLQEEPGNGREAIEAL
jgi:hypothetical protein